MENGLTNGHLHPAEGAQRSKRFADIPRAIDIPVSGGDTDEAVEVDLEDLLDDPTELCTLLENENVSKTYWTTIALAYAKQGKTDHAIEIVTKGLDAIGRRSPDEKLALFNCLCWLNLLKCRSAPRVKRDLNDPDAKIKDFYIRAATATLNEASRISPSFPPLFLARGVLCLLRAALQNDPNEKSETYKQALKAFDDALRSSGGSNMMALLGRGRALFSLNRYPDSLQSYQKVLERAPDLIDPDPRIGIGCCFWQLGYKDDAQAAWKRALELSPDSKIANILLGLYYLNSSSHLATTDPQFAPLYKKAMVEHTQAAFKQDQDLPLACATFGSYFLLRKAMPTVEKVARRAIELTDVNAIASDGWYLLARKEHYENDLVKAADYYAKADQARGGDNKGYAPAKLGVAQLRVLNSDLDGAKFRLEKLLETSKSAEAMTLLGSLYAQEVFTPAPGASKEDLVGATRKATSLLEAVRTAWKDSKRNLQPDTSVLLNLARLYEHESPDKSLACLEQVEQLELEEIPDDMRPEPTDDPAADSAALRELLPPQLLNNLACFHFNADHLTKARDLFQTALNACVKLGETGSETANGMDTDALVTTISFNLARTYESESMLDEAKNIYQGLLERHADYTDARARLAYIALRQSPRGEGPELVKALYESDSTNLEVRSLFGWYLRGGKRRTNDIAQDQEQRHYKHTLQNYEKYDRYALTAMGNIFLNFARDMRPSNDADKQARTRLYERAVEMFDKALVHDPRNAYAAQGIGIAMAEDKKDFRTALQIFLKVKETIKEASVFVNLGHVYFELKDFGRAIENYEAAMVRDRARDPQVLACLGRAWFTKGKQDKSVEGMNKALDFSKRAHEIAPEQVHFAFNIAFVQIQIATTLYQIPEANRTLEDLETAATGLDEAIESLTNIAKTPNPPFPRHDLEQRATMGRNTIKKQIERSIQSQRTYETKNAERLQQAKEQRDAEMSKRAEQKRLEEEKVEQARQKLAEERQKMQERDKELAAGRAERAAEEERRKEAEFTTDEETGERKKRAKRTGGKRKKKTEGADSDADGTDGERRSARGSDAEQPRKKKKRKLERRNQQSSKYKSSEIVVESDEDDELFDDAGNGTADEDGVNGDNAAADSNEEEDDDNAASVPARKNKKKSRVIDDEDEDDEDAMDEDES